MLTVCHWGPNLRILEPLTVVLLCKNLCTFFPHSMWCDKCHWLEIPLVSSHTFYLAGISLRRGRCGSGAAEGDKILGALLMHCWCWDTLLSSTELSLPLPTLNLPQTAHSPVPAASFSALVCAGSVSDGHSEPPAMFPGGSDMLSNGALFAVAFTMVKHEFCHHKGSAGLDGLTICLMLQHWDVAVSLSLLKWNTWD